MKKSEPMKKRHLWIASAEEQVWVNELREMQVKLKIHALEQPERQMFDPMSEADITAVFGAREG
jgi:hypothetical protein